MIQLQSCAQTSKSSEAKGEHKDHEFKINKTAEEWKATLTAEEYEVLREAGTERAFTGKYNDFKKKGVYTCAGCGTPLFSSESKFNSGTGWPSFYEPINKENVLEITDK